MLCDGDGRDKATESSISTETPTDVKGQDTPYQKPAGDANARSEKRDFVRSVDSQGSADTAGVTPRLPGPVLGHRAPWGPGRRVSPVLRASYLTRAH